MATISNYKVVSTKGNRAEVVYVDGWRSITRHCVRTPNGRLTYTIPAVTDKDGNEIKPAINETFGES